MNFKKGDKVFRQVDSVTHGVVVAVAPTCIEVMWDNICFNVIHFEEEYTKIEKRLTEEA